VGLITVPGAEHRSKKPLPEHRLLLNSHLRDNSAYVRNRVVIVVTDGAIKNRIIWSANVGTTMEPILIEAVDRLVQVAGRAGMSATDMIRVLNAGVSVETLLALIERNLQASRMGTSSSRWIT